MSAKRYCGRWVISITYQDKWSEYLCTITHDADRGHVVASVSVGEPKTLTHAVDSAIAYDNVAHAALSFESEKLGDSELDFTDSGFRIRRKR